MEKEIWKSINKATNYKISNQGRLKNIKTNRILRPFTNNQTNYQTISYRLDGKYQTKLVHRLVAETFISNTENKPQVNHIDGNKLNNSVDNLEWVNGSENTKHAYNTGLLKKPKLVLRAKKVEITKLSGEKVGVFDSLNKACKILKLHKSHAASCARGEINQHKGYVLNYL